ncbi:PREDICTED: dysbindin domain-containing protein 1 isoform X1 [Cercocebus atys]|uniref:dysbindin domain-containing protein 1 isoform X1 n=1 Tax=Cercocebus atys TaxID=9531 RepID=UPI0005F3D90A|nr:PREDICTED: dysbindin domain-containing protein 1 isoform X1 [Cercocebus atys]
MEPPEGAGPGEIVKEAEVLQAALGVPAHGTGDNGHTPVEEEVGGIPIPAPGLLQVTERRQPLSSVSSLEVHFDLLDLTELTDMSDQELAEVFADSDDENVHTESPAGEAGIGAGRGAWWAEAPGSPGRCACVLARIRHHFISPRCYLPNLKQFPHHSCLKLHFSSERQKAKATVPSKAEFNEREFSS